MPTWDLENAVMAYHYGNFQYAREGTFSLPGIRLISNNQAAFCYLYFVFFLVSNEKYFICILLMTANLAILSFFCICAEINAYKSEFQA